MKMDDKFDEGPLRTNSSPILAIDIRHDGDNEGIALHLQSLEGVTGLAHELPFEQPKPESVDFEGVRKFDAPVRRIS